MWALETRINKSPSGGFRGLRKILHNGMKFYFTFGFGQQHEDCYHIIEAINSSQARKIMIDRFGLKWGNQYPSSKVAGVERFGLKEIKWK